MKTPKPEVHDVVLRVVTLVVSAAIQAFRPGSVRIILHPLTPARATASGNWRVDNMARGGEISVK